MTEIGLGVLAPIGQLTDISEMSLASICGNTILGAR
jgi:hypothetical protein